MKLKTTFCKSHLTKKNELFGQPNTLKLSTLFFGSPPKCYWFWPEMYLIISIDMEGSIQKIEDFSMSQSPVLVLYFYVSFDCFYVILLPLTHSTYDCHCLQSSYSHPTILSWYCPNHPLIHWNLLSVLFYLIPSFRRIYLVSHPNS